MSTENRKKSVHITAPALLKMKRQKRPITMLTAYDAAVARLLDGSGVDALLVGDSLGMVFQGKSNTLSVTVDEVIYHARAVVRGSSRAHVVADMPFMSYQTSVEDGLRNAGRLLKDGGVDAVKLEGGKRHTDLVRKLTEVGIPVMGHLGLTPQSIHAMGGYKVQGRDEQAARELVEDARALEDAGAYAVVLEAIPRELAAEITQQLRIPTIGIGAGPDCDGQVLVINDLLGMNSEFKPKFVKQYADLAEIIQSAVRDYIREVQCGNFPTEEHSWQFSSEQRAALNAETSSDGNTPSPDAPSSDMEAPIPIRRSKTGR